MPVEIAAFRGERFPDEDDKEQQRCSEDLSND